MIFFDRENKIFYLENKKITYAFGFNPAGLIEHLYFGARIGHDLYFGNYSEKGKAHTINRIDAEGKNYNLSVMPQELHTPLSGDYNEPSLALRFPNGNRRSDFTFDSYEILPEKPALSGLPSVRDGNTLKVTLRSKGIKLEMFYSVTENEAAITRSMKITNENDTPVFIDRAYSFAFDIPYPDWEACYIRGASGNEARFARTPLSFGVFSVDSKRGMSSSVLNPFIALVRKETTETSGIAYGVNLVYSGSYALKAEVLTSGAFRVLGGINEFDFGWKLDSNESFQTPEAVLVYSSDGLSGMSREFHDLYRDHLIPERFARASRPIVINNWEATRFAFKVEKLKEIVDRAAGTGIDTFVLDDGWFGKREDQTSGLGDWFVNEEKMGGSLKSFIDYVHSKGMKFGLWFEPEMVSRDSDLYRAHPDWAMQTPDEYAGEGRSQLVLDLTRKEVRDYIVDTVNAVLDKYEIDYFKWDCNRDLGEGYSLSLPEDRQKEVFHRQVLGLYDLFERIVASHPDILFEGCASGGSRFDAGILYWFPQIWTSDQTDAPARGIIQYGTSMCYPLSAQSCHITESPNRRAKHIVPLETRAAIAHLGANGYELDTTKMTDEEISAIPAQISEYRNSEKLIQNGDLYRLSNPLSSNFFAFEIISKDRNESKITIMKYSEYFNEPEIRIFPQGFEKDSAYLCAETKRTMTGAGWCNVGFVPQFGQGDFISQVFHFKKV